MADSATRKRDLGYAAAIIALAIAMTGAAALAYFLADILLILFLAIVVAAALRPAHVWLSHWGVPKGFAVLLIYLLFIAGIALIGVLAGPALFAQVNSFATSIPQQYTQFVNQLQTSSSALLQRLGSNLPAFSDLTQNLTALLPHFFANVVAFMTSTASFLTYFVVVLALGYYWTMEVPHLERIVLSLLPVPRRASALESWREIEYKLGAFVRGQGLAMLIIALASAVGYFFIGLPHVLGLAVLAGLFEAVPLVGPIATAVLVALVALPEGVTKVLLVMGFSTLIQQIESNVLIPRIMSHSVGISPLAGLVAMLAFGSLFGVLGVIVAIPLSVVLQVILNRMVIHPEPVLEVATASAQPLAVLRVRVQKLQQRVRERLRRRDTRLASDAPGSDQVADAVDQRIEQAVEQVDAILATAQEEAPALNAETRGTMADDLRQVIRQMEATVQRLETVMPPPKHDALAHDAPLAPTVLAEVQHATQQVERAVEHMASVMTDVEAQGTQHSRQTARQGDDQHA